MTPYKPTPRDTSDIQLPQTLHNLMEDLAENTHAVWARQRMAEGWVYGAERNDALKQHPDLISYKDLSDGEKQYDRDTARETLKVIQKMGYQIIDPPIHSVTNNKSDYEKICQQIHSKGNLKNLMLIWHQRSRDLWNSYPKLYLHLGEAANSIAEPLLAYDILAEGIEKVDGIEKFDSLNTADKNLVLRLQQQVALALANCGATKDASSILQKLIELGQEDSESLGLLARTWKDSSYNTSSSAQQTIALKNSYKYYLQGLNSALSSHDLDGAYYCGINAATSALRLGLTTDSKELADKVEQICMQSHEDLIAKEQQAGYWLNATLAEACLLKGQVEEAHKWYKKAAEQAIKTNKRALGSMRNQARNILKQQGLKAKTLDCFFDVPSIVLFSGHMFDKSDRQNSRFPEKNEKQVRKALREYLKTINADIGYASAACGSDLIFLEEMIARNAEIIVVLPFDIHSFKKISVNANENFTWQDRFDSIIEKASEVKVLSEYHPNTMLNDFLFTNIYMYGRASLRAQHAASDLKPLLVWDGKHGDGGGGTASMANILADCDQDFTVIPPDGHFTKEKAAYFTTNDMREESVKKSVLYSTKTKIKMDRAIMSHHVFLPLLFADVKGYSKMNEREAAIFATSFMGELADVLLDFEQDLLNKRTQGDSLFLVFKNLEASIACATKLRKRISDIDWNEHQLPADLAMRISLDAGPTYSYTDPVTGNTDFCGNYVIRAARLEPVTPPGSIYASETFVSLATTLETPDVTFNYAGQIELPKRRGMVQAFHVTVR